MVSHVINAAQKRYHLSKSLLTEAALFYFSPGCWNPSLKSICYSSVGVFIDPLDLGCVVLFLAQLLESFTESHFLFQCINYIFVLHVLNVPTVKVDSTEIPTVGRILFCIDYYRLLALAGMQIDFVPKNCLAISENCCKRCFSSGEDDRGFPNEGTLAFLPLLFSLSK